MIIIDDIAWLLFRFVGLIQALLFQLISMIKPPDKLGEKIDLMSHIYGGWYIFGAKDKNSLPKVVRERGIFAGRIMLLLLLYSVVEQVVKVIIKGR